MFCPVGLLCLLLFNYFKALIDVLGLICKLVKLKFGDFKSSMRFRFFCNAEFYMGRFVFPKRILTMSNYEICTRLCLDKLGPLKIINFR